MDSISTLLFVKAWTFINTWTGFAMPAEEGDKTGSLEAGKLANLIIVDRTLVDITVDQIGKTRVLATLLGGEVVYDPSGLLGE